MSQMQKLSLSKNGHTLYIGEIMPQKRHLTEMHTKDELFVQMKNLIDKGIKNLTEHIEKIPSTEKPTQNKDKANT